MIRACRPDHTAPDLEYSPREWWVHVEVVFWIFFSPRMLGEMTVVVWCRSIEVFHLKVWLVLLYSLVSCTFEYCMGGLCATLCLEFSVVWLKINLLPYQFWMCRKLPKYLYRKTNPTNTKGPFTDVLGTFYLFAIISHDWVKLILSTYVEYRCRKHVWKDWAPWFSTTHPHTHTPTLDTADCAVLAELSCSLKKVATYNSKE